MNTAHQSHRASLLLRAMLLAVTACHSATAPDAALRDSAFVYSTVSSIPLFGYADQVPQAGKSFELIVNTYGVDGCWVADRTDVEHAARDVTVITPYNRPTVTEAACAQYVSMIPHKVRLTFTTPGTKRLIVQGRDLNSKAVVRLEATILVAP